MLFKNAQRIIENGKTRELKVARENILKMLNAAINAVDSYKVTKESLHPFFERSDYQSIYLLAFGKASVPMAKAVCDTLQIKNGIVITNETNNRVDHKKVKTFVADHPAPTSRNIKATDYALSMIEQCKSNDLLIVLISGGGSALFCKPRVSLSDIQRLTELLLKSGVDIKEINTIRKHLSYIKGGQLVRLAKCDISAYIISDVVGDPLEFIASGPTVPDSTTYNDAKNILKKYGLWNKVPASIQNILIRGIRGELSETPKPGDKMFDRVKNTIVANNSKACKAVKNKAEELGYKGIIFSTELTGNARDVGKLLIKYAENLESGSVLVAGGETTVKVKGNGKGGRNQEMILSSVEHIADTDIVFSSLATDGIDGNSDAAGAIADGYTKERAKNMGMKIESYLRNNDSYHFFKKLDELLVTGYTGTNVMDVQLLLYV
ncbi:MAG: glycerate kinase [Thermoplasmata archaeon]|nr:glycerate kinase [Thermoplasmata archaeon]